ncbi:MAG: hypothetical protein LBR79_05760 [Oscillospiraceae bacterium]|jgi:hypothetical protein|nr:hypothetical protein [Oscillospiraceae bacterium]
MKDGFIIKSAENSNISKEDLDLINAFTRKRLKGGEVYVFSVVLCDNDIDRDNEKFTPQALEKLSELFVGSTGILNHDMKSENQTARIFSAAVEKVAGRENKIGEPYYRVVAKAYMPRLKKNEDFIMSVDSGIIKEVSVGCAVENVTCSICGKDIKKVGCEHRKGKHYKKSGSVDLCYAILDNPTDAYEWSFVAVPAQKEAGVIKEYIPRLNGGDKNMEDIIKELSSGKEISLNKRQSQDLYNIIEDLEKKAKVGETYQKDLKSEVFKLSAVLEPGMANVMKGVIDKLSIEELKSFRDSYKEKYAKVLPAKPQFGEIKKNVENVNNTQFKI